MVQLTLKDVLPLIRAALREDAASRDVTSRAVIPPHVKIRARIIAKASGVAAGIKLAALVFTTFDRSLHCTRHVRSGTRVAAGTPILTIQGSAARSIFAAERTALNFLGHLSGIATLTAAYVRQVRGTRAAILDTRKTLPGLRALEKYAVAAGGGVNHRGDLSEAILIKTNHLVALSTPPAGGRQHSAHSKIIQVMIKKARSVRPRKFVEVEVTNLREFQSALNAHPDAVLLDNWPIRRIRKAVAFLNAKRYTLNARPLLEVSGGVTLANVRAIAKTGVDRISIGRLTHSAPSLDVSLRVLL